MIKKIIALSLVLVMLLSILSFAMDDSVTGMNMQEDETTTTYHDSDTNHVDDYWEAASRQSEIDEMNENTVSYAEWERESSRAARESELAEINENTVSYAEWARESSRAARESELAEINENTVSYAEWARASSQAARESELAEINQNTVSYSEWLNSSISASRQSEIDEMNAMAAYPNTSTTYYYYTVPDTSVTYYYEVPSRTVTYYYYDPVSTYAYPYNVYWDGYTGRWAIGGYASVYEVALYRGGSLLTTQQTTSQSYYFGNMMKTSGDYIYQVRGYNPYGGGWSDWVASGTLTVSNGQTFYKPAFFGPGAALGQGHWFQLNGIWFYQENNALVKNSWRYINHKWYYFNEQGIMLTGWQNIGGKLYYFNIPNGDMAIGTVNIGGTKKTFDANGVFMY